MQKIIYIVVLFISFQLAAQTDKQKELEEKKAKIYEEIETYQKLLQKEKQKEKSVLNDIKNKDARINMTEKLIRTTEKQTAVLNNDIYINQLEINKLERELNLLKGDYAKMLQKAYKSRSEHSRIMFVLSSENFLQAYKRTQYMKQYATFRKMQGDEIKRKQTEIKEAISKLQHKKQAKEKVVVQTEQEKKELEKQKQEQQKLVKIIQKDKKKLLSDIQKKQKETKEIDQQINKIIKEAIAEANRKKATETAKNNTKNPSKPEPNSNENVFVLTPEDRLIADNFKANKGRLPWPTEKGYVSQKHGDRAHAVHKNIIIHNSGVEITTEPGSNARAVFGGEVIQIQVIAANNKAVYVQHGNYVTVYLNLSSVSVSIGAKVEAKQSIGRIFVNNTGKAVMKFMIYQNTNILNPETWLYNM